MTPMEALKAELKFALNISITSKPVQHNPSESTLSSRNSLRSGKSESRRNSESARLNNNAKSSSSLLNMNKIENYFNRNNNTS
jgi:hypothetical protein